MSELSLGLVLDLIERYQALYERIDPKREYRGTNCDEENALLDVPVAALKQLAEQHAAQLRNMANHLAYVRGYNCDEVYAAADFLSPRREPEA
jgi:hypothetical protein